MNAYSYIPIEYQCKNKRHTNVEGDELGAHEREDEEGRGAQHEEAEQEELHPPREHIREAEIRHTYQFSI